MNIQRGNLVVDPEYYHNVGIQHDGGSMNRRIFENTVKDITEKRIDKLFSQLHVAGDHTTSAPLKNSVVNPEEDTSITSVKYCPTSPSADMTNLSSPYRATPLTGSAVAAVDDASIMSDVTIKLRKAAKKTTRRAKSKRAACATVPLHVKEDMLEKEFPHVRRHESDVSMKNDFSSSDSLQTEEGFLDQSFDDRSRQGGVVVDYDDCIPDVLPSEARHLRSNMSEYERESMITRIEIVSNQMNSFHELLDENQSHKEEAIQAKRKNDELREEQNELEQAMIEMKLVLAQCKEREDHHRLSMTRLKLDLKNSQDEIHSLHQKLGAPEKRGQLLTKSFSSAELPIINVRSQDPMNRKNPPLTRSWFGRERVLDNSLCFEDNDHDENDKDNQRSDMPERQRSPRGSSLLTKSLSSAESPIMNVRSGDPLNRKNPPLTRSWFGRERVLDNSLCFEDNDHDANDKNNQRPDMPECQRSPRGSSLLTKSLSSAESPNINVRSGDPMNRKNPPLTRSWFGKEDSAFCRENNGGLDFLNRTFRRSPKNEEAPLPPKPENVPPIRSRSFIDPKKATASKESEFMPSDIMPGGHKRIHMNSLSFIEPKTAMVSHEPIGTNLFLARHRNNDVFEPFDCRATVLSNITDATLEEMEDSIMETLAIGGATAKTQLLNELIGSSSLNRPLFGSSVVPLEGTTHSIGSNSTIQFEPAKPQLQMSMRLRLVDGHPQLNSGPPSPNSKSSSA